jgi:hypothetical protein
MTHEYTLLVGGLVLPGGGAEDARAIAWAAGTVLALGSEEEVRAISRGDSLVVNLRGAVIAAGGVPLEIGGPADFDVYERDPRTAPAASPVAVVRGGHAVRGSLPGLEPPGDRTFGA